jgi:phosphoglucosamine mutase
MVDAPGALYNGDELLYLMAADRMGRDEASCPAWWAR